MSMTCIMHSCDMSIYISINYMNTFMYVNSLTHKIYVNIFKKKRITDFTDP